MYLNTKSVKYNLDIKYAFWYGDDIEIKAK